MNEQFEALINKLHSYEEEIITLYKEYNPNDSELKMELLAMRMSVVFYKYILACFETMNETYKRKYFDLTRKALTLLSYGLTGLTLFKAPNITIPSLLGSMLLSVKNRKYDQIEKFGLTYEQIDDLLDLLDSFENDYTDLIENIFNQIDKYEDQAFIDTLNKEEQQKRIACANLMKFLRTESDTLMLDNNDSNKILIDIINDSLNTNSNNVYELIDMALKKYHELDKQLEILDNKDAKLARLYRYIV